MDQESEELDMIFGRYKHTNKHEVLAGLPPRPTVDRLVAAYFNKRATVPGFATFPLEYFYS